MVNFMLCGFYLNQNKNTLFMSNDVWTLVLVKDEMV